MKDVAILSSNRTRRSIVLAAALALLGISSSPLVLGADQTATQKKHAPAAASSKQERLISIVLLLREPRHIDEHALTDAAPGSSVVAKPPYYQVKDGADAFVVTSIDKPYFDKLEKVTAGMKDPAIRDAVQQHHAWLSVDWGRKEEPSDVKSAYQHIAKIAAALAGPDTLAIYNPDTNRFAVNNETVVAQLQGDDPLAAFGGTNTATTSNADSASSDNAGDVIAVDPEDPKLKAAEAEAKRHWSDFVAAFKEKNGSEFAVKGRISEGENAEYMWLKVSEVDGEEVHGTLDNEPAALTGFKMGQDLHIKLSDVDDWVYVGRDKKPRGGYTIKALDQLAAAAKTPNP